MTAALSEFTQLLHEADGDEELDAKSFIDRLKDSLAALSADSISESFQLQFTSLAGQTLFDGRRVHASMFQVPTLEMLPLHDHPGMTALMRVLKGRLLVRSFDWVERSVSGGTARLTQRQELTTGNGVVVLKPDEHNLHEIMALEDSAFLDVFFPYYSTDRPCSYFAAEEIDGDDCLFRMLKTG